MGTLIKRRAKDFAANSVRIAAKRSQTHSGLDIVAGPGSPTRNREVPRKKWSRIGACSVPFPQRDRIKQKFVAGKNISEIAREERRHWTTVAKIVKEEDVQEYVKDLRARFYGALEEVLSATIDYVKHAKDGGWLAYEMLKDGGVIP